MTQPLVSIIIPVFNAQLTIKKSLESVIHQTYINKEIIVVDGQSTDASAQIMATFNGKIKIIREPDRGVYDAINKGLKAATGEWIYILGADDHFAESNILEQVFSTETTEEKVIFGDVINQDSVHPLVRKKHHSTLNASIYFRNTLHQQSAFYHRSIFKTFSFNHNYKILADYDLHLMLFQQKVSARRMELVIAHCSAQGLSKNFHWSLYSEEIRMKKSRLSPIVWIIIVPVIIFKYFLKSLFQFTTKARAV